MYVCVQESVYMYVCVQESACMYVCVCVRNFVHHQHMCAFEGVGVRKCVCMYIYVRVQV